MWAQCMCVLRWVKDIWGVVGVSEGCRRRVKGSPWKHFNSCLLTLNSLACSPHLAHTCCHKLETLFNSGMFNKIHIFHSLLNQLKYTYFTYALSCISLSLRTISGDHLITLWRAWNTAKLLNSRKYCIIHITTYWAQPGRYVDNRYLPVWLIL